MIPDEVYLTVYLVPCPFTFVGMKEIDAEPRNNLSSVALLLPVKGKRIETVSLKIHHWIYLVHNTFAKPALRVLINSEESVPPTGRITRSVPVFPNRTGAELHPRLHCFYTFIYITYNFRNIIPPPLVQCTPFPVSAEIIFVGKERGILRITQIIEMYPVYIITAHDFPYQFHQIFFSSRMSRIKEIFVLVRYANIFHPLGDGPVAERGNVFPVSQRNSYHPGVAFHTPLVAFFNGKSERIITGISAGFPCQDRIERFDRRRI